ncbi:unnamed protein product, partial [Diabrotica balteata]
MMKSLTINGKTLEQVEIKVLIERARTIFNKMRKVLCARELKIDLRVRLARCYIFSILLYGIEAWILNASTTKKLKAFKLWVNRRILKISWTEHVTNNEDMRRVNKRMEI